MLENTPFFLNAAGQKLLIVHNSWAGSNFSVLRKTNFPVLNQPSYELIKGYSGLSNFSQWKIHLFGNIKKIWSSSISYGKSPVKRMEIYPNILRNTSKKQPETYIDH